MRDRILLLSGLALALFALSSCQRKSFDPALAGTFFPLHPGFTWTYKIVDKELATTHIFTDRVLEDTRLHGDAAAREVKSEYFGPAGPIDSSILYVPEHGYFTRQLIINNTVWTTAEKAFLPQVLRPNLVWSNSLVPFGQQPGTFHVRQTHRTFLEPNTVEIPAGHFRGCIRIETTAFFESSSQLNPPLRLKYLDWYAPHVGLVKTVVRHDGWFGSEVARIELLSFRHPRPEAMPSLPIAVSREPVPRGFNSLAGR